MHLPLSKSGLIKTHYEKGYHAEDRDNTHTTKIGSTHIPGCTYGFKFNSVSDPGATCSSFIEKEKGTKVIRETGQPIEICAEALESDK